MAAPSFLKGPFLSLIAFQAALADLVASPQRCLAARAEPEVAFAGYDLDDRERSRLISVVWQRGMSANCTVYRATRLIAIYTLLPLTCALLGSSLTEEVDRYWDNGARLEIHFDAELTAFAAHLRPRLSERLVSLQWDHMAVRDVLDLEVAIELLRLRSTAGVETPGPQIGCLGLSPDYRVVRLAHEPQSLLSAARANPPDFLDIPRSDCCVLISIATGAIEIFLLPSDVREEAIALSEGRLRALPPSLQGLGLEAQSVALL